MHDLLSFAFDSLKIKYCFEVREKHNVFFFWKLYLGLEHAWK